MKRIRMLPLLLVLVSLCACGRRQEDPLSGQTVEAMVDAARGEPVRYGERVYYPRTGVEAILLLGIDHDMAAQEGGNLFAGQADTVALLVIDTAGRCYHILPLDRNTLCEVPVLNTEGERIRTETMQLCLAHSFGSGGEDSCENTAAAVSALLLDIPVERYCALYMDAIPLINDAVGGVTVSIEDDFSGVDDSLVMGQRITLNGEQAYHYLRGRMEVGDGTNEGRIRRQEAYIRAFLERAPNVLGNDAERVTALYNALQPYMTGNLRSDDINTLVTMLRSYENGGFVRLTGTTALVDDHEQFTVDEDSLYETVLSLFYE